MISDKNQTFCFDLKNIVHETVIGDSHRLRQVLINIISNAVKYGKKEGVVNFCAEECEAKDAYRSVYRFIIRDNGRGMSQEFVQRIFEPFSREKTDETEKIDGSGLGMAIARQIVTQMGGTISLTSQLGIGSEFQIEIPLLIGEEKHAESFAQYEVLEQCEQIAATKSMDVKFAGIHALLVEDNEFNAEIAEEMLKMLGVSVVWAENGKEAVRIFSDSTEGEFDCIFMDIRMPGMDGMETTKWIRRLQRSDSNLPVFAMTANVFLEEVDKTKAAGMQDHIGKPISLPSVCQILTKWFPERIEKNTSIIKAFMI
jgi:CheY-like chemotaxis protein